MRPSLIWNWRLLCERLAQASQRRRRLAKLKNTPARSLSLGHIESLELLELIDAADTKVIYDVGANVGTWTLLAKSIFPASRVEAFEPLPTHHSGFESTCGALADVTLHKVALGPTNTMMLLRVTDFSDASSFLPIASANQSIAGVKEVRQVSVPVRRLEDYRQEMGLELPDLIKLDVQGYELAVLESAANELEHCKAIITEVSFVELYEGQCMFPDICSFLDRQGFRLHVLGVSTELGKPLVQADVLFIKKA